MASLQDLRAFLAISILFSPGKPTQKAIEAMAQSKVP
jgi:hypothetical protein